MNTKVQGANLIENLSAKPQIFADTNQLLNKISNISSEFAANNKNDYLYLAKKNENTSNIIQDNFIDQNKENKYYEVNRMSDVDHYNNRIMNRFNTMKNIGSNNGAQNFQAKPIKNKQLGSGLLQGLSQNSNKEEVRIFFSKFIGKPEPFCYDVKGRQTRALFRVYGESTK